jgi:hypothetical protein
LQGSLLQIDVAEVMVHEADEPNAFVDLDADGLSGEHLAEVDLLPPIADAPACGDVTALSWKG